MRQISRASKPWGQYTRTVKNGSMKGGTRADKKGKDGQ